MEKKPQKTFSFSNAPADAEYQQARSSAAPVWSRRSGVLSVAIWEHERQNKEGETFISTSLNLERGYKDNQGKWQKTNNLRPQDLQRALILLRKAEEYLFLESTHSDEDRG